MQGQYFMIDITTTSDGQTSKALWDYSDFDTAVMNFHQSIASAMANENVVSLLRQIIDGSGIMLKQEHWVRPEVDEEEPSEP